VWDVNLEGTQQSDLLIVPPTEIDITVDNIEIAQFIYLMLNNQKIRDIIDTISSKMVLILGRFTSERKTVLDSLRDTLRQHNYMPVLFDFQKPTSRDLTETVGVLAHMARFIIADVSSPRSIPHELAHVVKDLPSVPVQPIIDSREREYAMIEHLQNYPWFLDTVEYNGHEDLLSFISEKVIQPAERYLESMKTR
jgi:hypothetical protein